MHGVHALSAEESQIHQIEKQFASKDAPVAEKAPEVEKPVTPVVEAESEPVEAASTEGAEVDEHGKKRPGVHNRIDELTKKRREAEREAEYWRQQALAKTSPTPTTDAPKDNATKTLEDFGWDQEKYLDYIADQRVAKALETREVQQRQASEQKAQAAKLKSYQDRIVAFEAANPDIDYNEEVTGNASLAISQPMAEFIMDSDVGPQVALHLKDHPEEARAIFDMSPRAADRALAKLEVKLSVPQEAAIPSQPVQITRAPPVPSRVSGSTAASTSSRDAMENEIAAVRAKRS